MRYLGVPIISSRLGKADRVSLIDRITARVQSWTQRFLSFAGRLQLIKLILHAIQAYLDRIKQIPRQYLCKGSRLGKGRAKVSWEDMCLPKNEGGLGICRLRDCNKAVMLKHVWILFTNKESLWYKWTHSTFLKRKSFWVVKEPTFCSWAWKRILYLRIEFRLSFHWRVGDGQSVSFWFDHWHLRGPLDLIFSDSMIYSCSLSMQAMVVDLFSLSEKSLRIVLDSWNYPIPILSQVPDRFIWINSSSSLFSVALVWHAIIRKKARVDWASLIWNNAITLRYQFNLWLIIKNRLPTQALLLSYSRIGDAVCTCCKLTPDSIDHLFFGCCITTSFAYFWVARCNLPWRNGTWSENLRWAMKYLFDKDFYRSIVRLSFGALCHLIWKFRNDVLFINHTLAVSVVKNYLIKVLKDKALMFKNVIDNLRNRRLQHNRGIDPCIFSSTLVDP